MMRRCPAPRARARLMYARSRTLITCARMIRAVVVHSRIPITMITWDRLGAPDAGDDDHEHQVRDDEQVVGDPHQRDIHASAEVAGQDPDPAADDHRDQGGGEADDERDPAALHDLAEHVDAAVVTAQPVLRRTAARTRHRSRCVMLYGEMYGAMIASTTKNTMMAEADRPRPCARAARRAGSPARRRRAAPRSRSASCGSCSGSVTGGSSGRAGSRAGRRRSSARSPRRSGSGTRPAASGSRAARSRCTWPARCPAS